MLEAHRLAMGATNWLLHTLTGKITYRGFMLNKVRICVIEAIFWLPKFTQMYIEIFFI